MADALNAMPWYAQLPAVVFGLAFVSSPIFMAMYLEKICKQNERIISLLVDIKMGRKTL